MDLRFQPDGPCAYFISFRTYGTWLHGDERGSTDRRSSRYGAPLLPPNPRFERLRRGRLTQPPTLLGHGARMCVERAIRETCTHRTWRLHALSVRSNHVHVVLTAPEQKPEPVMGSLKAWATRRLRQAGHFDTAVRIWSHHGSTRYLWNEADILSCCEYVLECQGDGPAEEL
ncbi:MAG: transposase [Candidatus Sumerlaeia bacterium]|nr:transposase [Candidatus Sumerlaeia bacterium]